MPISKAPFFLRPYVDVQEFDLTGGISADQSTTAFVGSEFRRGPLRPVYVSGALERFYSLFGDLADPSLSFGHDTCQTFLATSSNMLINRVVNGAFYSAMDIVIDRDSTYGNRLLYLPHVIGTSDDYTVGASGPVLIKFDSELITGNVFNLDITDGTTISNVSQAYTSSHQATMTAIALQIQSVLNTFGQGGWAYVLRETSSFTAVSYTIVVNSPPDSILSYVSLDVTAGASQAKTNLQEADTNWLMTIKAENPGLWGDDIAVKITDIDQGIRERHRLTFSSSLVTGNSFDLVINDVPITSVVYASNSDATMEAIAAEISKHDNVQTAYVETTSGSLDNDRSIVIVAQNPGPDQLELSEFTITSGASQAIVVSNKTLDGQEADGSFDIEIYNRNTPLVDVERFETALFDVTNGFGDQIKYDGLINSDNSGSVNIRIIPNSELESKAGFATILKTLIDKDFDLNSESNFYMNGGDEGSAALTSNMVSGLNDIKDRTKYPVSILLNAGYTDVTYQQALVALSEDRNDCTAILDMPSERQGTALGARDYRLEDLNIDSSYGALYTPDVQVSDISTSELRFVPPSGHVGAAYAYNDRVAAKWAAPAGLNRGKLRQVRGLRYDYTPADQELLHPNGVNPIIDKPGNGPVIWGQRTLQVRNSALGSVHIRRLMNLLETNIADQLEYTLWEANTEFTRFRATQLCDTILKPIHRRDGLYDYRVVCDESNNTPEVINADALAVDVYVKPVRAIHGILLRAVIVKQGTNFSELIVRFNSGEAA